MHGLVNRALQGFVCDTHGSELWAEILDQAGVGLTGFEAGQAYDDRLTEAVIAAAVDVLHRDRTSFLEDLGTYLVSHPNRVALRRLLRFGGDSFLGFLRSLEDLPGLAQLAVPGLDMPELRLRQDAGDRLVFDIRWGVPGAGSVVLGVLRAMAKEYGVLARILAEDTTDGCERLTIDLEDPAFTTGQDSAKPCAWQTAGRTRKEVKEWGAVGLSRQALDQLMPMHLLIAPSGNVVQAGPTLAKIAGADMAGRPVVDVVDVVRPRAVSDLAGFLSMQGARLRICLRSRPNLPMRGMIVSLPGQSGGLLNLSLGVSAARAVAEFGLTLGDFPPCDQTVDMLYLHEANRAIVADSRSLTERLQRARQAAEQQALSDTLTGLANRRAMDLALRMMADDPLPRFGLMHLDLDFFKEVNDSLGHAAGDHVLERVGDILRSEIRAGDIVARVGGDEFILLFSECDDPELMDAIGARLISRLEAPICFEGQTCRISASAGSVLASHYDRPDPDRLLKDADLALYASKNRGRAQHTLFTDALLAPLRPN